MTQGRRLAALFDWDGTVYQGFTILPWTRYLNSNKLFSSSAIKQIEDLFRKYEQGEIDHDNLSKETSLIYAADLSGRSIEEVSKAAIDFASLSQSQLFAFAKTLFSTLSTFGMINVVVSGAPAILLRGYAKYLAMDHIFGLELTEDASSGKFLNSIKVNPGVSEQKALIVQSLPKDMKAIIAFGNSLSDLPLFDAAEFGIVVNSIKASFPEPIRQNLLFLSADDVDSAVLNILTKVQRSYEHP